ncbi:MAG: Rrf2 family transcriptional regulator [bacterium]|nr:Rrf2 family transcriptional regulator [bacterium]
MKITSKSHYGVQVMADLAKFWGKGPISLSTISQNERIPHDYLEQLMIPLRRYGLVKAKRGTRGGYLLSREPRKITLKEIIQALEGDMAPVVCVAKGGKVLCPTEKSCGSKKVWQKVQKNILQALNAINLKEVLE